MRLCDVCLGIFKSSPLEHGNGDDPYFEYFDSFANFDSYRLPHHPNSDSLQLSADMACKICCDLKDTLSGSRSCSTEVVIKVPRYGQILYCFLTFQFEDYSSDPPEGGKFTYSLEPYGDRGTPPTFSNAGHPNHRPTTSTGSDETLDLIRSWTETCFNHHNPCFASRHGGQPKRLLDVTQENLRLVVAEDLSVRYTTLSHCWGGVQFTKLTKSNFDSFSQGFPSKSLPKTFQDAISVTRSLGIDFIWIDSICIIQDAPDDWEKESAHMGEIYQYSYCNIAAVDAHSAYGGLFFERDTTLLETFDVHVSWDVLPRNYQAHGVLCPDGLVRDFASKKVEVSPLNDRGWVLQEQLLAPRTVSFGEKQVMWFCRDCEACEAFPKGVPLVHWSDFEMGSWPDVEMGGLYTSPGSFYHEVKQSMHGHAFKDCFTSPGNDIFTVWHSWAMIVREYTRRRLTVDTDKLVALNGITSLMAKKMHCQSHAGILYHKDDSFTLSGLLWSPTGANRRTSQYRAPSWSWAAVEGPIFIPDLNSCRSLSKIEYMETQTQPGNMSGQVTSGVLCITGPIASGNIFPKDGPLPSMRLERWDDDLGEEEGQIKTTLSLTKSERDELHDLLQQTFFLAMIDNGESLEGLVLKCRQDGKFERMGTWAAWDEEEEIEDCGALKDARLLIESHGTRRTIEIV